jgi:hypothetical protein
MGMATLNARGKNGKVIPREIETRLDPGPPVPGTNCHICIDGVGYIFADLASYTQESGKAVTSEQLAPYFGDPTNALDTLSSDMTMLLPIGQGDFSEGMGFTDLEKNPKGYDRAENLIITPQGTLFNGPKVIAESFSGNPNPTDSRGYAEGYFGGTIAESGARNYFGIGGFLYRYSGGVWAPLPCRFPITDIRGYSGRIIVGYGANGGDVFYNDAASTAAFRITRTTIVNGSPFVVAADGRIYSAFISPPNGPIAITDETGTDAALDQWAYAVRYGVKMPDNSLFWTGLGSLSFATKLPNHEIILSLPALGYHGGPVLRQLYRSKTNDLTNLYLIADETVLGPNTVRYVDTLGDAGLNTLPTYDFNSQNTTGNLVLLCGEVTRNMQFPDTRSIWLPENLVAPYVGDFVNSTATFHDAQGNEALLIGTTSGLFIWDGQSVDFQTVRSNFYHQLNYKYMAVNHGFVYYTLMGTNVYAWNPIEQVFIQGPWISHFNTLSEIRLINAAQYIIFSVTGIQRETGKMSCILYWYDGQRFSWAYRWDNNAGTITSVTPILGQSSNSNDMLFYKGQDTAINRVSLTPMPGQLQTDSVYFRSSFSDGDLPRLRKQVHAVMVRYLHLSPAPANTILSQTVTKGSNIIPVADTTIFAIGDWLRIDNPSVETMEYRKVTGINTGNNSLTLTHTLGANLKFDHAFGQPVRKCVAITTLRNVFTDALSVQDIEVGGPCNPAEQFAYLRLPVPVYAYADGIELRYNTGVIMELTGWSILTGLNPQWNGLSDMSIRLQDYTKLPNNMYDNATAATRQAQLKAAYNKGTVEVCDPLGNVRTMRFQRLSFTYEEPKERHPDGFNMQATASVRLIDQLAELNKNQNLVLGQLNTSLATSGTRQ